MAADPSVRVVALHEAPRAAIADLLSEFGPGEHSPRDFAASLGYAGVDRYVEFWTRLVAGPWPELGLVKTDSLVALRGARALGEVRLRHTVTPKLALDGGNIGYEVRAGERGRGYATQLMRAALERAGRAGIERALLTVRTDNAPSLRVVEKFGGVAFDEVPFGDAVHRRFWVPTAQPD